MRNRVARAPWSFTEYVFLGAFLFWSVAGLAFTLGRVTPAMVGTWSLPAQLRDFVDLCIYAGDPVLILLAFVNSHLHAARQWSGGVARGWAVKVVLSAYVIEYIGTTTSIPFGDYHYTERFGPMLGPVPLVIPLAWHVIVTNAMFIVRATSPSASGWMEAFAAGLICTVYDIALEPFATTVKGYWVWGGPTVPLLNYISWFFLSALLIRIFVPRLMTRFRTDPRPWLIVGLTVLIFLAGEDASLLYR
jgi:uncharacterized membrane protein